MTDPERESWGGAEIIIITFRSLFMKCVVISSLYCAGCKVFLGGWGGGAQAPQAPHGFAIAAIE